jgi:uncharacterized cupredoxin-like copper-binding protein
VWYIDNRNTVLHEAGDAATLPCLRECEDAMKKILLAIVIAAAAVTLSGCGHHQRAMYVRDAADRVKAADWSKMETATVTMTDFAFNPATIVFRQGVPYKLVIENKGTQKHYFTAEGFFRAIATRKLQSNTDGEVKAPYFSAIEVYPGRTLDLYFIPVTKGSYHLICTIEGHADRGMKGEIRIE